MGNAMFVDLEKILRRVARDRSVDDSELTIVQVRDGRVSQNLVSCSGANGRAVDALKVRWTHSDDYSSPREARSWSVRDRRGGRAACQTSTVPAIAWRNRFSSGASAPAISSARLFANSQKLDNR